MCWRRGSDEIRWSTYSNTSTNNSDKVVAAHASRNAGTALPTIADDSSHARQFDNKCPRRFWLLGRVHH
jgi:hypothetical protein